MPQLPLDEQEGGIVEQWPGSTRNTSPTFQPSINPSNQPSNSSRNNGPSAQEGRGVGGKKGRPKRLGVASSQLFNHSGNPTASSASSYRLIALNDPIKNELSPWMDNRITTCKYSFITFIPKFLQEQFSKYANLFFLFTGCIQLIPGISPTSRFGTLIPLSIVLAFSALKEAIEDLKRNAQDELVNRRLVKVLVGPVFIEKPWSKVVVGDVVRVENGEFFPADLVLLSSSEPDALCYIETSNLDGETNLKIRQGKTETASLLTPELVSLMDGSLKTELPNSSLYTFDGTLSLGPGFEGARRHLGSNPAMNVASASGRSKDIPLSPSQLLLRGAQLRNTRWVYGVVVFTGHETKLLRNATAAPIKRTKLERMMNEQIIFLFGLLVAMTFFCSIAYLILQLSGSFQANILREQGSDAGKMFGRNLLTYTILFNNLIPLSLIVTMEFVKFALGMLINYDLDMYHTESDTPANAKTSSLVEELGMVDCIFSDKTGTLTCNMMEFKMVSIGGLPYTEKVPDDRKYAVENDGTESGYLSFAELLQHRANPAHPNYTIINEFITVLGVCHTVIPEHDDADPSIITYQASSPDEAALVQGAKSLGALFHTRRPKSVTVNLWGTDAEFQILNICEFNSTRKRMSCIVRCPNGQIKLYIKGADTVIFERLADPSVPERPNPMMDKTMIHLEEYATDGLRTLCIAYRDISPSEYQEWSIQYDLASTSITNRSEELDRVAESIERDLVLLGATAIEDRLQDGVPDTIHTMMEAGVRLWVLTGDRQETAINIGFSCRLLNMEMNLMVCNELTHYATREYLTKKLQVMKASMGSVDVSTSDLLFGAGGGQSSRRNRRKPPPKMSKAFLATGEPMALVIDGKSLGFALEDDVKMIFLELAMMCKTVICCRVSPLQKALVVMLVKDNVEDCITLAIGDGANDVSMIQAAHVGVGISGQEGLQAARSADFAIAQFRYLSKLLLVHGGWAYTRICKLILYSFYKNICLYLIQLWFATDNGFSGQTLFETWSCVASYNVLWAVTQPIVIGLFDQYAPARMLDRYPQLYKVGQKSSFYSNDVFGMWILNSFIHSIMIYYLWRAVIGESVISGSGQPVSNWLFGSMVYVTNLVTVSLKAALIIDSWVSVAYFAVFGSILLFFAVFPIYSVLAPMTGVSLELTGIAWPMYSSLAFWAALILIPIMVNFRDFIWKYIKRTDFTQSYHVAQEIYKYNIPDYRPRQEWFRKAVHKARMIQRIKRSRGYAFSQNDGGQLDLIRSYDTTKRKPLG